MYTEKQSEKLQYWEQIKEAGHSKDYFLCDEEITLYRLWVPGGWLVKEVTAHDELNLPSTSSICYMPDPEHSWDIQNIAVAPEDF